MKLDDLLYVCDGQIESVGECTCVKNVIPTELLIGRLRDYCDKRKNESSGFFESHIANKDIFCKLHINKKYIDHWTICDTGSTDNTKEIIQEELSKIPGNLYSIEFEDFSQARNKSIELSSKKCKYTIILDDSYIIIGGDLLRRKLQKSKSNAFTIKI